MVENNMGKDNCVVYTGSSFTIEWYYDVNGYSQAYEYFLATAQEQKRKFFVLVKRLAEYGKIFDKTKFRYEGAEIYAFKPQPDRYLAFFRQGRKIIITNAFCKKSNKLPKNEKLRAQKNRTDYLSRF
ncbi:MAG: type II toxin-antitoxin system RelE/ParE family toxin [Candidatus Margulisbacteria bacterium]|nr:type II toxin-antitoxin system RelE/ParE family toxin [Candidatus Margulisiibacteriota bacterium]